jgi:hypothetical protein
VAITQGEVHDLLPDHPGLAVLARRRTLRHRLRLPTGPDVPDVLAVRALVAGVVGGGRPGRLLYELVLDVRRPDRAIPTTWVVTPPDAAIRHANVWPADHEGGHCPWLGQDLPHLCWFRFEDVWAAAPATSRTVGAALDLARQLLNTENHDSPAR